MRLLPKREVAEALESKRESQRRLGLEEELKLLEKALVNSRQQYERDKKRYENDLSQRLSEGDDRKRAIRDEIRKLEEKRDSILPEIEAREREVKGLLERNANHHSELADRETQLSERERRVEALALDCAGREERADRKLEALTAQEEVLNKREDDMTKARADFRTEYQDFFTERYESRKELEEMRRKLLDEQKALETQMEAMRDKEEKLNREKAHVASQQAALKAAMEEYGGKA